VAASAGRTCGVNPEGETPTPLDFNTIGWTRLGSEGHPRTLAVLLSDGDTGLKWMEVGKANTTYRDLTGHIREAITTNADGWAEWRCLGDSVSVWVEQEALAELGIQV
jgi:alpha-amylase